MRVEGPQPSQQVNLAFLVEGTCVPGGSGSAVLTGDDCQPGNRFLKTVG